jgi:hypothetical protein
LPDHALDSMLDARDLPVKEEADGTSTQLDIGKQLGSMDVMDCINRFVFDAYAFINQEIGPISTIEHDLFVADRNRIFSVDIRTLSNCTVSK